MIFKIIPVVLSKQDSGVLEKPERYLKHMSICFLRTNCLLVIPHDGYLLVSSNGQFPIEKSKTFWGIYVTQFNKQSVESRRGEDPIPEEITFELTPTTLTPAQIGNYSPYTIEVNFG